MRIKAVVSQPDRAGRHMVQFEDGTSMRLYRQTVEDFGLYPGLELDEQTFESLQSAAGAMSAKMRAVRIVAATNVSQRDLEQRLIRKGENPAQAKEAVQWMADLHLVDDRTTAEQVVQSCARKGYGLARARQMLYEKRIPKELWEDVLGDYPDQTAYIAAFLRTRLKDTREQKEVRKAMDALLRRGHSYGDIRRGMDMLSLDTDEFPEE